MIIVVLWFYVLIWLCQLVRLLLRYPLLRERRGRVADTASDSLLCVQMTEQRKQKQRIGLLGHPPHMNINPQQPA